MKPEQYIQIEDEKFFKSDIEQMSPEQIKTLMMFATERDLRFIQAYCSEQSKVQPINHEYRTNKKILSDYESLDDLVRSKVAVLEKLDRDEYGTSKGITNIFFAGNHVYVQCDDSSWGRQDYTSFKFPIIWLTQPDEAMVEQVTIEKDLREFNRLKAKFESKLND